MNSGNSGSGERRGINAPVKSQDRNHLFGGGNLAKASIAAPFIGLCSGCCGLNLLRDSENSPIVALVVLGLVCILLVLGLVFAGLGFAKGVKTGSKMVVFLSFIGLLLNFMMAAYWFLPFLI